MKITSILLLLLISELVFSVQTEKLPKHKIAGKEYYIYSVNKGDSWYSIARKFKVSYSEIRLANTESDKLITGKKINIPANKLKANDAFYQKNHLDKKNERPKSTISKTHKVKAGENLFSISKKYNLSVDNLKSLNHLNSTTIHKDQVLIISDSKKEVTETVSQSKNESKEIVNSTVAEVEGHPKSKNSGSDKIEVKPISSVVTSEKKEEAKVIFSNNRQEFNEIGVAGWIEDQNPKSTKYYALHRTAPIGTIIKITNRMNSSSIYVKVVGKLPDTGDNSGLIIKLSKAGAEKLGVIDERFQAELVYGQNKTK